MKFRSIVVVLAFVLSAASVSAQVTHSQEMEVGTNGRGEWFASDYIMLDIPTVNGFARPFWVNDVLNRVEFAVGPTFKTGDLLHKLSFGVTTDKELIASGLWVAHMADLEVMYIADFKHALGHNPSSLYQKLFIALEKKGRIKFRYEQLNLGQGLGLGFVRPGIELQAQFTVGKVPAHLFFAPFYDPLLKASGAQIGFRFFEWKLN